jgi:hypothetical protein
MFAVDVAHPRKLPDPKAGHARSIAEGAIEAVGRRICNLPLLG